MSLDAGRLITLVAPPPRPRREGFWRAWRQLRRNYLSLAGSCIVLSLVLVAAAAFLADVYVVAPTTAGQVFLIAHRAADGASLQHFCHNVA